MPVIYSDVVYDYRTESLSFSEWLNKKDDEGWEFVTFCPRDYSGLAWNHIVMCIFRKKV